MYHTQFNAISSDLLRKAMKEPENYRDLLVRVASYCTYFVELTKEQQLEIINRTEHQGWENPSFIIVSDRELSMLCWLDITVKADGGALNA